MSSIKYKHFCCLCVHSKFSVMKWTKQHDLELIKEILAERPFDHAKGSRQIGITWQRIVDNLNARSDVLFNLKDIRAVRDRYLLLQRKFKRKTSEEIKSSGVEVDEPSELNRAIEEAVGLFEGQEENREKEKTAKEEERNKAEEVRLLALETVRETGKRKAEARLSGCSSFRAKRTATLEYLKEKADKEMDVKKMEIAHKEKELEVRRLELELKYKELEALKAQNHSMLNILLELVKRN